MKTVRKGAFVFALLALVLVCGMIRPVSVHAGVKKGLVKEKGRYYYYQNGKKLKSKWKSIKAGGKKYRFYFGKKGAAYKAPKVFQNAWNVKIFKIGKKKYGFDNYSHLASPGIYVTVDSKVVVIGKKGIYNEKKTKSVRKKLNLGYRMEKGIYKTVTDIFGKPSRILRSDSCDPWNETDSFTDVVLVYPYLEVQLIQNDRTKAYGLNGVFLKEKR